MSAFVRESAFAVGVIAASLTITWGSAAILFVILCKFGV